MRAIACAALTMVLTCAASRTSRADDERPPDVILATALADLNRAYELLQNPAVRAQDPLGNYYFGQLLETRGEWARALAAYRDFLKGPNLGDTWRRKARQRIKVLQPIAEPDEPIRHEARASPRPARLRLAGYALGGAALVSFAGAIYFQHRANVDLSHYDKIQSGLSFKQASQLGYGLGAALGVASLSFYLTGSF